MFCVRVPASSANLGPGFDALALAVSLYNYIEVTNGPFSIQVIGEGQGELPEDETNLVYEAFQAAFACRGQKVPLVSFKLVNSIPIARGLGSSAAAIVGGLAAANQFLSEPLDDKEMFQVAVQVEGHPDNVSAALFGGMVISCSADDQFHYLKTSFPAHLKLVVAVPEFKLSTKEARDVLPASLTREQAVFNLSRTALLTAGLLTNNLSVLSVALDDQLHQPYRSSLVPGMAAVFAAAKEAGALGVALSGAGPSVIAFVEGDAQLTEKAMKQAFEKHQVQTKIIITAPADQGAELMPGLRVSSA